jgi:hypothetical protein
VNLDDNRIAVFLADPSGVVYSNHGNPLTHQWAGWDIKTVAEGKTLPGAPITAVALGQNRVTLFLADSGGGIYSITGSPVAQQWGGWANVPRQLTMPGAHITPLLLAPNKVVIFFANAQGEVFSAWGNPHTQVWQEAKSVSQGSTTPGGHVSAVHLENNRVAVFVADPSGVVFSNFGNPITQQWDGWDTRTVAEGKTLPGAPVTAVKLSPDRIALFATDTGGGVVAIAGNPVTHFWPGWGYVSGRPTRPGALINAVQMKQDRVALFIADFKGEVFTSYGSPITQDWDDWSSVGQGSTLPGAPVSAVCLDETRVALFIADPGGGVYSTPKEYIPGFDVEFLMGQEYIKYFLLTGLETGSIHWWFQQEVIDEDTHEHIRWDVTLLRVPEELKQKRLYHVQPNYSGDKHPYFHEHPNQDLEDKLCQGAGDRDCTMKKPYSSGFKDFDVALFPTGPDEERFPTGPDIAPGTDIRVTVFPILMIDIDHPETTRILGPTERSPLYLDIKLSLVHEDLRSIGLRIELLDISGGLLLWMESGKEKTLKNLQDQLNRTIPFSAAGEGEIARIQMKKFVDEPKAIGVYMNLVLQDGPRGEDRLPADRGHLADVENTLPLDSHMFFRLPQGSYERVANDLLQHFAEVKPDKPEAHWYPLKDSDGNIQGEIKEIKIYPQVRLEGGVITYNNVLVIDVHGELDFLYDPDFFFSVYLYHTEKEGLLDFDLGFDFNLSNSSKLALYFAVVALTSIIVPVLPLAPVQLGLLAVKIIEKYGEQFGIEQVRSRSDVTSFLGTLPHKLTVEKRRWDPLYFTRHCVEIATNDLAITNNGFSFSAKDIFIGKQFEPVMDMVIREVTRDETGTINGLLYLEPNTDPLNPPDPKANDLKETTVFPAVDRMSFTALRDSQRDTESYRVELTIEQAYNRLLHKNKGVEDKHRSNILYLPQKIQLVEDQIYQIAAISSDEIEKIKKRLGAQDEPEKVMMEIDKRMKLDLKSFEFADFQNYRFLTLRMPELALVPVQHGFISEGKSIPGAPISAVPLSQDQIALVIADSGGGVYSASGNPFTLNWTQWFFVNVGSTIPGGFVTPVDLGGNRMAVFVADSSGIVYSNNGNPITQKWDPNDPTTVAEGKIVPGAPITAVPLDNDYVTLFAADTGGGVRSITGNPGIHQWGGWELIRGQYAAPGAYITPLLLPSKKVAIFFANDQGEVFSAWGNPHTQDWHEVMSVSQGSTTPGGYVSAVKLRDDRVAVFIANPAGVVFSNFGNPFTQEWNSWEIVAEGQTLPGAPVTAVGLGDNRVGLFLADRGGGVYAIAGDPVSQVWSRWNNVPNSHTKPGAFINTVPLSQNRFALFITNPEGGIYYAITKFR